MILPVKKKQKRFVLSGSKYFILGGGAQFIYLKSSYLKLITPQCCKGIEQIKLYTQCTKGSDTSS